MNSIAILASVLIYVMCAGVRVKNAWEIPHLFSRLELRSPHQSSGLYKIACAFAADDVPPFSRHATMTGIMELPDLIDGHYATLLVP